MRDFESLKQEGRIREVKKDKAQAEGLLKRSKKRLENQERREVDEDNAFEVLENVYESLRETLEAGMKAEGFKSEDHVATIAYAEEKLGLEDSTVNKLHRYRKLRNKSRYEAKEITVEEAEEIIKFAAQNLTDIRSRVNQKL